jgi:glucose 1-dehydrogenase
MSEPRDAREMFGLSGRRGLVTGGSRGIGRAIAVGLGAAGADVLLTYAKDEGAAKSAAAEVRSYGRTAEIIKSDLTVPMAGKVLAAAAIDRMGTVDIIILNASRSIRRPFADLDADVIGPQLEAGLVSNVAILQSLLPPMASRGWGRVVVIGSVQQVRPNPALLIYAATKAAMSNVMANLARQYGPAGVTLNTVAPGLIATEATAPQIGNPETLAALLDEIPTRSVGQPDDCVGVTVMLCSDAGRYITGVDIFVDGGMHLPGKPSFIAADGRMTRP